MKNNKTPLKKEDIHNILSLSKTMTNLFFNEVKDKYLIFNKDNTLSINNDVYIFKHQLPPDNKYQHYQKIYINTVRSLYNEIGNPRKHKQLGYIFKMLPYINIEYNVFCNDAFETDIDNIKPMTVKDFCNIIGYQCNNESKLIKELASIKLKYKGKEEYLISYISHDSNKANKKMIIVNPHIVYNGSNYHGVEILGVFCK